jgi:tetratricopeptide (TPR) repeat protein
VSDEQRTELFRSENLAVRKVGAYGEACCVVTFDSFTDFRSLDRTGFGEHFFATSGIDAIHVIPRDNDWYDYPEMAEAMACVQAATRGYARVVAYGSSMGAYAAIRFAGLAGAQAVLALSPQYSIDPAVVPWEQRWPESARAFRGLWERRLPLPDLGEAYVVYDTNDRDRKHVALLAKRFRCHRIGVPGGGHPVTGYLAEVGLLQEAILAVCAGRLDIEAFKTEAQARRPHSAQYLLTLSKGYAKRRRWERVALMREAVRLAPDNGAMASRLGIVLARAGLFEESLAMHRRSLELMPGHPNMLQNYSFSLEASGDLDAALAVMEALDVQTGGAAIYRPRLQALRAAVTRRARRARAVGAVRRWFAALGRSGRTRAVGRTEGS